MTQSLLIVRGYHSFSPRPAAAFRQGLTHRVAFVQESYRNECVDSFFDCSLFETLIAAVSGVTEHDQVQIYDMSFPTTRIGRLFGARKREFVGSLDMLHATLVRLGHSPPEIDWSLRGERVLAGVAEDWYRIGGPAPYHDTYTFSLFVRPSASGSVYEALRAAAEQVGAQYETMQMPSEP